MGKIVGRPLFPPELEIVRVGEKAGLQQTQGYHACEAEDENGEEEGIGKEAPTMMMMMMLGMAGFPGRICVEKR